MAAFLLTITLTLGGTPTLDINANITLNTRALPACGTAWVPHVTTINPACDKTHEREHVIRHELEHHDQWSALGPAYPLAYLATGGRAFEDYLDAAWVPPEGMTQNCPLLRVGERVEFMPCYRF